MAKAIQTLTIYVGNNLRNHVSRVKGLEERNNIKSLYKFLENSKTSQVFAFCGLRRTGKSTMMAQAIYNMDKETFDKTCLIIANGATTFAELNETLSEYSSQGYRYFL